MLRSRRLACASARGECSKHIVVYWLLTFRVCVFSCPYFLRWSSSRLKCSCDTHTTFSPTSCISPYTSPDIICPCSRTYLYPTPRPEPPLITPHRDLLRHRALQLGPALASAAPVMMYLLMPIVKRILRPISSCKIIAVISRPTLSAQVLTSFHWG